MISELFRNEGATYQTGVLEPRYIAHPDCTDHASVSVLHGLYRTGRASPGQLLVAGLGRQFLMVLGNNISSL